MSRENKKLSHKQWNQNRQDRYKEMSHANPDLENGPHWNPVDFPADGLESYEDYDQDDKEEDENDEEQDQESNDDANYD